jgi:U11-48K-like CHHC zinc finger
MKKSKYKNVELERIPCPIDPSHSIYKHNLPLHSKICNVKTRQLEMKEEPFYCLDCNSGLISTQNTQNSLNITDIPTNNKNTLKNTEIASNPEVCDDGNLPTTIDPDNLLKKIKHCFHKINGNGDLSLVTDIFEEKKKHKKEDENFIKNENGENGNNNNENTNENGTKTTHTDTLTPSVSSSILPTHIPTHHIPSFPPSTETCPYLSDESYVLLESRVLCAVSGTQVAFERVRHARQDARIVR